MNSRVTIAPPQMSSGRIVADLFLFMLFCLVVSCTSTGTDKPDYELLEPTTMLSAPEPVVLTERYYSKEQVKHGKYMVELLGCSTCHTDGALVGTPNLRRLLAGSRTGIAFSDPLTQSNPGVVFPGNLTSDPETGIGLWNESDIIEMLRTGVNQYGQHTLSVMPWPAYAKITDEDAVAIAAYLMSLPPVKHEVPRKVRPGKSTEHDFVHFGVYRKTQ
ncbi:cytochrome C [Thalassomonas viridans]|uniref:Cytochrome C n=1 Tax=Thalassomonas viridans TaxID=137584 RepID=A0AAE9YYY5_9GAMM|nr:cytochrome C [Thalassomonas viridans]WDE02944.1 cytochrome C [Thalassomonas viridans]